MIIRTIPISKNSIAWYVMAIRLTEERLQKSVGSIKFFVIIMRIFIIFKLKVNKQSPIRHLEKSTTNNDDPASSESFADVGTTAKHKEDIKTINIPYLFFTLDIMLRTRV